MATKYFENFPIIEYEGRRVRDITRRSGFVRSASSNPYLYYPYTPFVMREVVDMDKVQPYGS